MPVTGTPLSSGVLVPSKLSGSYSLNPTFTATLCIISGVTLTIPANSVIAGTLTAGMSIAATGVASGCVVRQQESGTQGGPGVYLLSTGVESVAGATSGQIGPVTVSAAPNLLPIIPNLDPGTTAWCSDVGQLYVWSGTAWVAASQAGTSGGGAPPQPQTAAPTSFSPTAGTYSSTQTVSIACTTAGAVIYYTTDGSQPTYPATGTTTQYSAPFMVAASAVVNAIAVAPGYTPSAVAAASYIITVPTANAPTFSPAAGSFTSSQTVTISSSTSGASIYYTTDGSQPTYPVTGTTQTYSGPITVSATQTVTAIAVAASYANSPTSSATYTITTQTAAPTFSPVAGTYTSNQNVVLSGPTGSSIYYTIDGSTPTYPPTGTTVLYQNPIPVPNTGTAATPVFNPAAGTYSSAQSVAITSATGGASIYYTLDGSTPTTSSALYAAPVTVGATETLKAIAVSPGYANSAVGSAAYVINSGGGGGTGATTIFDYSAGFSASAFAQFSLGGSHSQLSGTSVILGSGSGNHTAGGFGYSKQVPIGSFTAQFTFKMGGVSPGQLSCAGMTFCINNSTGNPNYQGPQEVADANCCGFGTYSFQTPPNYAIALKYDLNYSKSQLAPTGVSPNSTGCYTNGGPFDGLVPEQDLNPCGINLYTGDLMQVNVVYDGSILTQVIKDTVTGAQARFQYPVNIPAIVNGSNAYVAFTQGIAPDASAPSSVTSQQILTGFKFATGYNTRIPTPTLSVQPGSYAGTQTVTVSAQSGASIYYSTNGLLPTSSSNPYPSGGITIASNTVLYVIAIQSGYTDSFVAGGVYSIGNTNTINFPTSIPSSGSALVPTGIAKLSSGQIVLNDGSAVAYGNGNKSGACCFGGLININRNWTTTFKMNMASGAQGLAWAVCAPGTMSSGTTGDWQAISGPTFLGFGGSNMGLAGQASAGLLNSVEIKFDAYDKQVGLFTNAPSGLSGGATPGSVTLDSGHDLNVSISYNAATFTLSLSITDTVTSAVYSVNYTVNIPATIGANTGYFMFSTGTGGANSSTVVKNWVMN